MDILVAGYGVVGKHVYSEFKSLLPEIYDKYAPEYADRYKFHYDVAFVCVPTEMSEDGSADISEVDDVVSKLDADIIIIKSAIPVGTADKLIKKYNKNIIVSPEYYGGTVHSVSSPNFVILGGDEESSRKAAQLYYKVKKSSFRVQFTDAKTAELAKYMENCFLALKVTFCSEFYDIAKTFNINYERLRELFIMDERMGDSHTFVYEEEPYYNSHCLNKDIPGLIISVNDEFTTPLMCAMHEINMSKKRNRLQ